MCTEFVQIIGPVVGAAAVALLSVGFVLGCANTAPKGPAYLDPHALLFAGTAREVEDRFKADRPPTTIQALTAEGSDWLLVSRFPYRGRDMFDLYLLEQPNNQNYGGEYTLRAMFIVHNSESMRAEAKSERHGIAILHQGREIAWITPRDHAGIRQP